jgi:Na+/melibiose symporter-like transporter
MFSVLMVFGFGVLYAVPLIITAVNTRERLPVAAEKSKFSLREFVKPLKLKPFVYLIVMYLAAFVCMDLITTNIVYMAHYGLSVDYSAFLLLAVIMVSYAVTIPLHNKLMKTRSKVFLFRAGIPLYIIGIVFLCLYPSDWNSWFLFPIAVLIGVGLSGCQLMPWYIFPDIVDLGELKFNERNAGSFSGIMTFIRKSTAAIAIGISGWVLELSGFIPPVTDPKTGQTVVAVQTSGAILGLRLVVMIPVILFITLAFLSSLKLKIGPERSKFVARLLDLRKRGAESELTEEELSELEAIKKECL